MLIPAFAVDRTPVVLKALAQLRRERRIPDVPIFVNSPMAVAALAVYRDAARTGGLRPDLHLDEFMNLPNLREVTDAEESKRLNRPEQPCIIVSSSGMATGGRVLHHLEYLLPNPRNTVIFTGYQGVGTRGRQLLEGATEMKFRGRFVPVKAEIVQDGEFSVHADGSDLIDWLAALDPKPHTVFCVHGEQDSADNLAARIRRELGLTAVVPHYREVVALQPADAPVTTPPQGIGRFIKTIVGAGVASRDHYLIDEIPRARLIEVPVFDLEMEQFDAAQTRKPYLFEAGRRAATACLRDWGNDLSGERRRAQPGSRPADRIHDERAVMTASAMMRGFANRLSRISRSQLFISYSHRDKAWLDVVKAPLEPYVELRGLQVWDDTRIEAGELWRDAIDRALASTRVALLLVSPGFLASPFIRSEELGFTEDS